MLWKSGTSGGVVAECEISSEPDESLKDDVPDLWFIEDDVTIKKKRVRMIVLQNFISNPIPRELIKTQLPNLSIIKYANGTNFKVSKHEYNIILELLNKNMDDSTTESLVKNTYQDFLKCNLQITQQLLTRFIASLLAKPFVILTGLSGSGKTKLAQSFALWICENINQYCIVPVGADWTNREPLLGFPNALKVGEYVNPDNKVLDLIIAANKNKEKPHFLILDEMNLSHVERYFADFLSVMETGGAISLHHGTEEWNGVPSEITLPKNLFIIGTVNIDETTYMFSPKVLDRANVIEFRVTADEMKTYLDSTSILNLESLKSAGAGMAESFLELTLDQSIKPTNKEVLQTELVTFFEELRKTGSEFGYRCASDILRFAAIVNKIEPSVSSTDIIDAAIMQKLLPKVHGSRRKLEPVLKTLGTLCLQNSLKFDDYVVPKTEIDFTDSAKVKYPLSLEKILRMYRSLIANGFTSYAEA